MTTSEPFRAFLFQVDVNGIPFGGYMEVDGLDVDLDIEEFNEAGRNESTIKLVGYAKPRPITLKKGLTDATQLQDWIQETIQKINAGDPSFKRGVLVTQLNYQHEVKKTWNLKNGFPGRHSVGPWRALDSGLTMEEITIHHDGYF